MTLPPIRDTSPTTNFPKLVKHISNKKGVFWRTQESGAGEMIQIKALMPTPCFPLKWFHGTSECHLALLAQFQGKWRKKKMGLEQLMKEQK